jgi:hypothetical protein
VQNIDLEAAENLVGSLYGQYALSFQYVVEVGLGDSGKARERALGGGTTVYALAKLVEETLLQIVECHGSVPGTISPGNRVLVKTLRTIDIKIRKKFVYFPYETKQNTESKRHISG